MALRINDLSEDIYADEQHFVRGRYEPKSNTLSGLKREIAEEVSFSLGQAARKLEAALEAVHALRAELDTAASAEPTLLARYHSARDEALLRLRYLKIQREALGLTNHKLVDKFYPVPARL